MRCIFVLYARFKKTIRRPTRVHNANGISIGSDVFVGLTVVSDKQTDTQTSVARGCIFALLACDAA